MCPVKNNNCLRHTNVTILRCNVLILIIFREGTNVDIWKSLIQTWEGTDSPVRDGLHLSNDLLNTVRLQHCSPTINSKFVVREYIII